MAPPTLSDLDVYRRLSALAEELEQIAVDAVTVVGEAAAQSCAQTVRGAARVIYEHCLSEDERPH